jgi:hypothetical protein
MVSSEGCGLSLPEVQGSWQRRRDVRNSKVAALLHSTVGAGDLRVFFRGFGMLSLSFQVPFEGDASLDSAVFFEK